MFKIMFKITFTFTIIVSLLLLSNVKYCNGTVVLNNTELELDNIELPNDSIKPEINKYKYKEYLEYKKQKRMCNLFKVFFEKQSFINYNDPLFIEIFSKIYGDENITNINIELFYIKNKCYSQIYESKLIITHENIREIFLTIIFLYGIFNYTFYTIIFFIVLNILNQK